ncbi:hypothetical protein BJV74DRAFT_898252 [Russula compacta]|nr:hypothetical protein BJV74DRAFT_898252 [Russula compacta]
MSILTAHDPDPDILRSVVYHVFMPPKLPQVDPGEQTEQKTNVALCDNLIGAATDFIESLPASKRPLWMHIIKMMELARRAPFVEADLQHTLSNMAIGGTFVFFALYVFCIYIRAQNASLIVRRPALADLVQFEVFEVSPLNTGVMSTEGKLLCSYPGPVIQMPTITFMNESFLRELSSFLVQMNVDHLDSTPTTFKAGSMVYEVRESANPRYISELLMGILRGFGQPAAPWRRSPLWLTLRVALQTSLRDSDLYKPFMLFFHAHLLRTCLGLDFPSELLYIMRAKMARRLSKLGPGVPLHVSNFVHKTAKETEALLSKRWVVFQTIDSINPTLQLKGLDFIADTHISLHTSYNYLAKMLRSASHGFSQIRFTPSHASRLNHVRDFTQFTNGQLANAISNSKDKRIVIADFELSVETNLKSWVATSTDNDDAPDVIASCIEQYFLGRRSYNSVMILTIMDLWVALDTLVIHQCPLLNQYSPEIPSKSSIAYSFIASHIEEYLCLRHKEALSVPSIFSNTFNDSCFAVKYFRTSRDLKRLYDTIITHAQQEREAKRAELASDIDHVWSMDKFGQNIHTTACRKCKLGSQARALKIHVHEWPLPPSTTHAQLAVFELSPPRAFSVWRDTTYMILRDIGLSSAPDSHDKPKVLLDSFSGLRRWAVQHRRVTIGSTTKSFTQSHYKSVGIPTEEPSVLVNNGLSFKLFDSTRGSWLTDSLSGSSVAELCTPPTPTSSPYSHLHHFVCGTQHTPNDVIAAQADCPKEISLHEFIAFSGLRSCPRLQWLNIARELASPSLSFRREEVHTLITQAAWQLGPLSDGVREWHVELSIPSFGRALLHELESLLERIKANWLEEVTVRTIALITSRLMTSTKDPDISGRACELLREARNLTYQWICELEMKLDSTQDEASRAGLRHRLCMLAMTCFSTLDACSEHILSTLTTDEDFAIAIQCAVIVHDNTPSLTNEDSLYLNRMLKAIFSHPLPAVLGKVKLFHSGAFDRALARLWLGYRPHISSSWHALPKPNSRWIYCATELGKEVHYDLLTGQLLIGGKPLGRLPKEMVEHPTYASILGTRILDVAPADIPGMDFMTRSTILFSWNNGDLILRARKPGDSQILQLIPRSTYFVDQHTHWLDLAARELEFRPAESPWTSRASNWRLYIQKPGIYPRAILQKPGQDNSKIQLIGIRSRSFGVVSSLLSPLELPEYVIAMHTAETLEVSLPRLHLSFFVNADWELECRSMPGYVIDKNQSCGTMFGLRNKLILCPSFTRSESLLPRRVIIPQGEISFKTDGDFTDLSINTEAEKHVRWHEYTIDTNLRCLSSNSSLISKLYQSYLHALTSHCLPDPLLGHTGTEEALYILRSAACRSFQRLKTPEAKLLGLISDLSPDRVYYPPHRRSMATVKWNDLPALSQHHDFCRVVSSILDHANALEALYDQPVVFQTLDRNQFLLNRAASRNKSYYPSDLHVSEQHHPQTTSTYETSWSIWNGRPSVDGRSWKVWDLMKSWGSVGPAESKISFGYSRYWLEFDAAQDWFMLYDLCRNAVNGDLRSSSIKLSFCLSAAAYSQSKYADTIPLFIIFALDGRCRDLSPPMDSSYALLDGLKMERSRLEDLVSKSALPIVQTPAHFYNVGRKLTKGEKKRKKAEYDGAIEKESSKVATSILRHGPYHGSVDYSEQWLDASDCKRRIVEYAQSVSRNNRLNEHVLQLQGIVQDYRNVLVPDVLPYVFSPQFTPSSSRAPSYSIRDVLESCANFLTLSMDGGFFPGPTIPLTSTNSEPPPPALDNLEILIKELQHSRQRLLQLYGIELNRSRLALLEQNASQSVRRAVPSQELLRLYHDDCSRRKDEIFSEILTALAPSQIAEKTSRIAGAWPRITPRSILRQLAQDRISTLPDPWKSVIIHYAVSLLQYQQSLRLLELLSKQKHEELLREIEASHSDVLAESSPDWLLIQIEANLLARPIQVAVAREMISPSSKRNISLQLNMGEGKSSVIVPLVTSTLADGSNLVRVVTLKPLSNQMFQLLANRLSGLANRPIFYLPFSRSLRMSTPMVGIISGLYRRCVANGGVLVIQPEHILSQKLMHIDVLLSSEGDHSSSMTRELGVLQGWVAKVSRDVLDESDEILHVRYQLVYSAGKQMPVDDHPNRWITTQQVFSRLQVRASTLCARFPRKFEIDTTQRGFPIVRLLDSTIFKEISSLIIDDALAGGLSNLPLNVLPLSIREATRRFMAQREISDEDHCLIHSHCAGTTLFNGILLLRGLLMDGDGILGYVLKERRWRVDYGLDPSRTLLAVPYRAKDVPSLKAEFAHPDVAIALTCLSYYYGGLTKDQVLLCFDLLAKLDNPEMEYDHWVELEQDLPTALRQLSGVNTEDEKNKRTVDFYLSQVVFPRAAREFPSKLPTSPWDLVEDMNNVTTGFSGTNDNRYLLPTSITQEDPHSVLGTNALVLQHLLRPENDHYECTEGENGMRESATAFLQRLVNKDPEIRVLLDVGAQMLELRNEELARLWLTLRPDVSAAIFFDDLDHLTVVTPDGMTEPKCVVYLDDAHTRGTDLKLPRGMRAAVTLGPKVTKDRLVQGCMRMRQLGKGHSVMFFAPGEVDRRIRSLIPSETDPGCRIQVLDVLRWAMHETCEDIRHHLPYWAEQGLDHHKRFAAYQNFAWLQPESRTLEEMYSNSPAASMNSEIRGVPSLRERIVRLGVTKLVDVRAAEEQEREVCHEVERERQIERPPRAQAARHMIYPEVRRFIDTGNLSRFSRRIYPLLLPITINMAQALDSMTEWSPSPLATADFTTTVVGLDGSGLTDYLRPINWILSSGSGKDSVVLAISPYEAHELLPLIRKSKKVRLHIYTPRVTSSMRSFSDLRFYSIPADSSGERWSAPAHVRIELNLFAGQLYFDSREEYERVCVLLALSIAHPGAKYNDVDGFVPPAYRTGGNSPFMKSKISMLKMLIGLRRKGMGYHRTHLGQILNTNPLSEETLSLLSS